MIKTDLLHQQPGLSLYCQVGGKTIYELVIDELEDEVNGQTRNALDDHLLRCPTCCDVYVRLKNVIRVIRTYPGSLATVRAPQTPLSMRRGGRDAKTTGGKKEKG